MRYRDICTRDTIYERTERKEKGRNRERREGEIREEIGRERDEEQERERR